MILSTEMALKTNVKLLAKTYFQRKRNCKKYKRILKKIGNDLPKSKIKF